LAYFRYLAAFAVHFPSKLFVEASAWSTLTFTSSRERALIKQRCERFSYKVWRGVKGSVPVRKV